MNALPSGSSKPGPTSKALFPGNNGKIIAQVANSNRYNPKDNGIPRHSDRIPERAKHVTG